MTNPTNTTDRELLQRVYLDHNALTTTDTETQLANRFELVLDEVERTEALVNKLDEFDVESVDYLHTALHLSVDYPNARKLLDVLTEFDIDDAAELRKQLARLAKFEDAMQDLAEPLTQLQTLITTE